MPLQKPSPYSLQRKLVILLLSLMSLAALLLSYATFIEPENIQVHSYTLKFKNLPPEFEGLRLLVLADLHYKAHWNKNKLSHIKALIDRTRSDVILGLGDYVSHRHRKKELVFIWQWLAKLRAPEGVFFINGNHDHWASNALALSLLEKSGKSLRHRSILLKRGSAAIAIAGAGDFYEDTPGIDQALAVVPENTFKIVLAHSPDSVDLPRETRADLFISGHTHGGQVKIPFWDKALILPLKNKKYSEGIQQSKRQEALFISRGIGWSMLPFRFNCPPEIAVLVLKKQ